MIRFMIIFLLLIGQLIVHGQVMAQKAPQKKNAKEELTFTLKEPKLEKKNAIDWGKTTGCAAGTVAVGGGVIWLVTQPKDKEKPTAGLPTPPNWPSR
jgi:hypothetical protein